jgi:hypothetical protein
VTSGGGLVAVSGSGASRFPYVQSVSNPFPATGDFSLYCKAKYTSIGTAGTGACVGSQLSQLAGGSSSGTTFAWWGDAGYSEVFIATMNLWSSLGANNQNLYLNSTPSTGTTHEYETCVIGSTVTTYRDGVQIGTATLPVGWVRPAYLWFGNLANVSPGIAWSSFETNKIEVRQLGAATMPASGSFAVNAINEAGTAFTVPTGATSCTFVGAGTWNYAVGTSVTPTGSGATLAGYIWPMPTAPAWSLIAKKLNGTTQYVGLSTQMAVVGGESILFMMNDGQGAYADNSGAVSVTWACQ